MNKKRILITGSSGFIGNHLIKEICKNSQYQVIPFENKGKKINLLSKREILKIKRVDIVIHLAAEIPKKKESSTFFQNNVLGTLNILDYCVTKKIKKLIFISSYVYGLPKYNPIDEKHPIMAHNSYSKSKILAEELCKIYSKIFGLKIIILRPFNIFGKNQINNSLISNIEQYYKNKKSIKIMNVESKRDFLFITDFIKVILIMIDFETEFDIFNVGSGKSYSFEKILKSFEKITGIKIKTGIKKHDSNTIPKIEADISKIYRKTGWKPEVSLIDGIKNISERN